MTSAGHRTRHTIWLQIKKPAPIYESLPGAFDLVAKPMVLSVLGRGTLFDGIISRANGTFYLHQTVVLALKHCADPTETLRQPCKAQPVLD